MRIQFRIQIRCCKRENTELISLLPRMILVTWVYWERLHI